MGFALNPKDGFYVGVRAGIDRGPATYRGLFTSSATVPSGVIFEGTVHNSMLGGGGGAMLGYRLRNFRMEGEGFYNYTSADNLEMVGCRLQSPTVLTPTPVPCPGNEAFFSSNRIGFNGSTSVFYGMVNGYYDIVAYDNEDVSFAPYVGFGIGRAYGRNRVNFVNTTTVVNRTSFGNSNARSSGAAQFILGISYYLDDYTWIGTDYRYVSTGVIKDTLNGNHRYVLNMLNFNINFSFDNNNQ